MAVYSFKVVQNIPVSLNKAWAFFSDPSNLASITPADMRFRVTSIFRHHQIYPGQIIEYKVSPILGIPLYWMTEITHVKDNEFFVDEQRYGPYSLWHHQHHFKAIDGGVEMTDIVHYKLPFWWLGDVANALFVRGKLRLLFDYRLTKIEELFGQWRDGDQLPVISSV
jgi:ligand-binding SRPBCC domain-containing protein